MTMRSTAGSLFSALCLAPLLLGGCRQTPEAESAPPAAEIPAAAPGAVHPDSLYGATATENLRSIVAEFAVRGLPRGWDGIRVAAISDFHLGVWQDSERVAATAVRRALDSEAELIVLLGDYLEPGGDAAALDRVLTPLRGNQVVAVLGDRDVQDENIEALVTQTLQRHGIGILRNEALPFARGGDTAYVAGLDPRFGVFAAGDQAAILSGLRELGSIPLLLTHTPDIAPRMPEASFPVILAGNTFCGAIEVPGTRRLQTLATEVLADRRVQGTQRLFRVNDNAVFVTCGVGYSFVPVRFGAPPEVALLTLTRVPEDTPPPADPQPEPEVEEQ